jgi:hypothetical protein
MVPAVSFAYEGPELDIMERMPRSKRDHLVNRKLLGYAYLTTGIIQSFAAYFTYCYVLNDYGIKPVSMLFIALEEGYFPSNDDVYNPHLPNFGNRNYGKERTTIFWDGTSHSYVDLRLFYVFRLKDSWSSCRWNPADPDIPRFWVISDVTDT